MSPFSINLDGIEQHQTAGKKNKKGPGDLNAACACTLPACMQQLPLPSLVSFPWITAACLLVVWVLAGESIVPQPEL